MKREYHKWYSPALQRDMELLIFGHTGTPVLFFPTRTAHFYDYENWRVINAMSEKINKGYLQVYCVDSVDIESFYCKHTHPANRIKRHMQYEQYIIQEVLPLIWHNSKNHFIISAGCSFGAYHAVNIALRHPQLFGKVVGMSGRYDLTLTSNNFADLLEGYWDENVYYNMPAQYIPNLRDENLINKLKKLLIVLAVGKDDPFLPNNYFLHQELLRKGVSNTLHIWKGEAHRSFYWRRMVNAYL
jgi:esterase/lipase superfamily enzyme